MEANKNNISVRSVKDFFRTDLTPNIGEITVEHRKPSNHEKKSAEFLLKKFGGIFKFLPGQGDIGLKTPDVNWSGILLEIKSAKGKSSVDSQIRKALQQVNNNGVILLDVSENKKSITQVKKEIINRIRRETDKKQIENLNLNIIIIKNNILLDVLEITKKVKA